MPMYLRCLTLIRKQISKNILSFAVNINFSVLMFRIFARISLQIIENAIGGWAEWLRRVLPKRKARVRILVAASLF